MAKTQTVEEAPSTVPLPEFTPVSTIVRREVRTTPITPRKSMTRASHKNWRRTMKLLKSLGKRA